MVENRDAKLFAIDLAGIVHPAGAMPPDQRLAAAAFGIDHQAGSLRTGEGFLRGLFQLRGQADGEGAFLGVAERDLLNGRERDVKVDHAASRFCVEPHCPRLGQQSLPPRIHPVEAGVDDAGLFTAGDPADALEYDLGVFPAVLRWLVAPEIEAVDIAVTEP